MFLIEATRPSSATVSVNLMDVCGRIQPVEATPRSWIGEIRYPAMVRAGRTEIAPPPVSGSGRVLPRRHRGSRPRTRPFMPSKLFNRSMVCLDTSSNSPQSSHAAIFRRP